MKLTLREWQTRLSSHFKSLAEGRSAQSGASIFILEHGLTAQELSGLNDAIRAHILTSPPLREHELPWMVYAAELGYRYSGDEYWQTFEKETPGWIRHAKRDWIRDCFAAFKHRGGAVPSGPWAQHFSIICWPLTHAILPRDLQVQLARLLYEVRFQFTRDLIESPQELGRLIAHRSFRCTSRFQDFAQQTALIGQIAAALVGDAGRGHRGFLLDSTLLRITTDLEGHRNARDWLTRARNEARDRTSLHGLLVPGQGRVADLRNGDSVRAKEVARGEATRLGLEPGLQVRPSPDVGGGWDLLLELPDLSGLLIAFPEFASTLKGSRCTVTGYRGRPLARERLLHSGQTVPLHEWPSPEQVLLHFDQAPWELEFLLRTECLLPSARIRVFKIASDGIGYELKRPSVRAGSRYLVVSPDVLTTPIAVAVPIACRGLSAAMLDVPAPVTPVWHGQLHQLGIGQLGTLTVWPAGLPVAKWDGEGRVECLTSERTLMAIQSDYPLASLTVRVDRLPLVEQRDLSGGKPSYVELPAFPPGRHAVTVSATDHAGREEVGELEFTSREPSFWAPGASQGAPLLVSVDPPRPSLEDMWEGRASLEVSGPTGRVLTCDIALHDFQGAPALATKRVTNIPLPVGMSRALLKSVTVAAARLKISNGALKVNGFLDLLTS